MSKNWLNVVMKVMVVCKGKENGKGKKSGGDSRKAVGGTVERDE